VRRRGRLIVLEGIDGVGKSTLQRRLAAAWRKRGVRVVVWREPSDRRLGSAAQRRGRAVPLAGAIYFTLDRALARPAVERALAAGAVVLQDRSYYSTLAYQASTLSRADRDALARLQRAVTVEPDRIVWLDLAPADALGRIHRRGERPAPLERSGTLGRVREAYRALARDRRWKRFDAALPRKRLADEVDRWLAPLLRERPRRRGARYRT
jgi:dTMP kinase